MNEINKNTNLPFFRKYLPRNSKEIVGQDKAVKQLKEFIVNFKKQKKKGCIIYGPIGCGKTSSVHALANELNYEILEVNASDFRDKERVESIILPASRQMSLFGMKKVILIDEIDGLSGEKDRGGIGAIAALVDGSSHPLVLTSNNPWDRKFNSIRKKCEVIGFEELTTKQMADFLKKICVNENIKFNEMDLRKLARRSAGDLRGALIDLQTLLTYSEISKEAIDALGERQRTDSIKKVLKIIFKTKEFGIALGALENIDEDYETIIAWIDANLPKEYTKGEDLWNAYNRLSKADVFSRRIKRWQYWRFLVYISALLSAGIALAKKERYEKIVEYEETKRFLKIWIINRKNMRRNSIAEKIAKKTHQSVKDAIKEMMLYKSIYKMDKKGFINEFDLTSDEKEWLES